MNAKIIPSDRQIPISVNEGTPIVTSEDRSDAAAAFEQLAAHYLEEQQPAEEPLMERVAAGNRKRRFAWRS